MNIPLFIIVYNQYSFLKRLLDQLEKLSYKNLIILDNASTYKPLLDFYDSLSSKYIIKRFRKNYGHKVWKNSEVLNVAGDVFAITDPDLELNKNLPVNFMETLFSISIQYDAYKVGFAIDINSDEIRTDIVSRYNACPYDWEKKHWSKRILNDEYELYLAGIDTTFCLVNSKYEKNNKKQNKCIRVAGDFTCIHRPWIKGWEIEIPNIEIEHMMKGNISSSWL